MNLGKYQVVEYRNTKRSARQIKGHRTLEKALKSYYTAVVRRLKNYEVPKATLNIIQLNHMIRFDLVKCKQYVYVNGEWFEASKVVYDNIGITIAIEYKDGVLTNYLNEVTIYYCGGVVGGGVTLPKLLSVINNSRIRRIQ